jgi:alcohol dehydrogenase class IV
MEMMPDIAICDPLITLSMPKHLTAETGMDAMTHALEAYVSNRANYVSDILAKQAILDIFSYLPIAYEEPNNIVAREMMLNASMVAGLAFTNVSLGIVHSMAHALGSYFHIAHGLANAILNPFVINYNLSVPYAREKYQSLERAMGVENFVAEVRRLNRKIGIPNSLSQIIPDAEMFKGKLEELIMNALSDGCTKTNPLIPSFEEMKNLFIRAYEGEREL